MIQMDATKFRDAVEELAKEVGTDMDVVMSWQMALWTRGIILSLYSDPKVSESKQRKMGENAITGDILGKPQHRALFTPLKEDYKWWEFKPTKDCQIDANVVKTKDGARFLVDKIHFLVRASTGQLEKLHRQNRRTSDGRVSVAGDSDIEIGRWKVKNTYMVPRATLEQYVKEIQSHVGRAKSSWLKAYRFFQAKAENLISWMPPQWVERNGKWGWGYGIANVLNYHPKAMTGTWVGGSNIDWGKSPKNTIDFEGQKRLKDLAGPYAIKRLQGLIDKHQKEKLA